MENTPATLKISEKARKYHFLPRKSMLVLRKNSTGFSIPFSIYDFVMVALCPARKSMTQSLLNAERFPALFAAQHPVENRARHKYGRKQVRQQTKRERGGESLHRPGTEDK